MKHKKRLSKRNKLDNIVLKNLLTSLIVFNRIVTTNSRAKIIKKNFSIFNKYHYNKNIFIDTIKNNIRKHTYKRDIRIVKVYNRNSHCNSMSIVQLI